MTSFIVSSKEIYSYFKNEPNINEYVNIIPRRLRCVNFESKNNWNVQGYHKNDVKRYIINNSSKV